MTSIRGHGHPCRERISESLLESLPPPEPSHDETPVNLLAEPPVAKYIEEDLQRIFRTVLKTRVSSFHSLREKPLKAKLPDVYYGKSHIECYNFCQQCEDYFATARAKGSNRILFAVSFLRDRINFCWQQYKWKHKAKSIVPITWEKFKTFLCQSLGDSRAFVDSYWAKIRRDSQYQ